MNQQKVIPEFGIIRENEERRDGGCAVIFDPATQRYAVNKHADNELLILISGGVGTDEDIQDGILREVTEESGLHDFLYVEKIAEAMTHYYNFAKKVNRVAHATCLLVILRSTDAIAMHLEEHEKFTLVWATAEEILTNWRTHNEHGDHSHWIYFLDKAVIRAKALGYVRVAE